MKQHHLVVGLLIVWTAALTSGCATTPSGYDRVATTSLGMGALGTALGYAATGDPKWAAVGGLSGLAGGYVLGEAMERDSAAAVGPPPPAYYDPGPEYGYYPPPRCRTERTVIRENGVIVEEYRRRVCD